MVVTPTWTARCDGGVLRGQRSGSTRVNSAPPSGRLATAQLAAVLLDDAVADRQAQARALAHGLGGEKGVEDARQVLGRDAGAVVGKRSRTWSLLRQADAQLRRRGPPAVAAGGVRGVLHQVHHHLQQLPGVANHMASGPRVQCTSNCGAVPFLHPVDGALDHRVQVDRVTLLAGHAEKRFRPCTMSAVRCAPSSVPSISEGRSSSRWSMRSSARSACTGSGWSAGARPPGSGAGARCSVAARAHCPARS